MQRLSDTKPDRQSTAATRKYARSLSLAVREGVDPTWFVEWNLLIMQGKAPILRKNGNYTSGYHVVHDDTRPSPTLEQQERAIKFLTERGWGQPVQQLQLDAELRGQIASLQTNLTLESLSGALTLQQREAITRLLGPGVGAQSSGSPDPSDEDLVDAEDEHAGVIDVESED